MNPQKVPGIWFWWLTSGFFLGLPFLYPIFWWLLLMGVAMFLYGVSQAKTLKVLLLGSFVVGVFKYAGALAWVFETYPLTFLDLVPGYTQLFIISVYWLLIVMVLALGTVLMTLGLWHFKKHFSFGWLAFFPFLFVIGEIFSSFLFSVYALGPGSYVNTNFSFGYVGYPVSQLAILFPIVSTAGVYGLSFIVATAGTVIFLVFNFNLLGRPLAYKILGGFLLLILLIYLVTPTRLPEIHNLKVLVIETRFDSALLNQTGGFVFKRDEILNAVATAIQVETDVVLLPEDSRFTTAFDSATTALQFLLQAKGPVSMVVDSARITNEQGKIVLRAFYYDLEESTVYVTDKQYLVPQGEYIPYLVAGFMKLVGQGEKLSMMQSNQNYEPGLAVGYQGFPTNLPGVLFCFESSSPLAVRKMTSERSAPLVFHLASHARFQQPHFLPQQLKAMLRVQAIWNNKTIVEAGNMTPSKVYYPTGVIGTGRMIFSSQYWQLIKYNL